jgi:hypothetical protein
MEELLPVKKFQTPLVLLRDIWNYRKAMSE